MLNQAIRGVILAGLLLCGIQAAQAAPYAALVMDARTGKVLHARNADTRLHPASLTKMMTLYVVFDAINRRELSIDQKVRISKNAAAEPPSKLGLKAGQRVSVRNLIRAASVKSANDAATALGEAVSGSEAAFARRMTRTARALGMSRSTFKNAHGLTASGHLSTARDMTKLGRRLFFDFPDYYNLFSRRSTQAAGRTVVNTNRRLLSSYQGADGIKTGYTRAAGFNLVASAERGRKRVIATVFGGSTSAKRNARVAELLDLGFNRSPRRARTSKPPRVNLGSARAEATQPAATTRRVALAVTSSPRPQARRAKVVIAAVDTTEINAAVAAALEAEASAAVATEAPSEPVAATPAIRVASATASTMKPLARPILPAAKVQPRIVTRVSTSGGRYWAVQLGAFNSRGSAEKHMLKSALRETGTLQGALRQIDYTTVKGSKKFRARFVGLSQADARKTCARMQARNETCQAVAPGT